MSAAVRYPPEEIARRFPEIRPPLSAREAVIEANRCLFCFDAPCTGACPTHIDVPRFIKKIASGNLRGAALTILDANILGLSCSRVCPVDVLCEGACVMHRYSKQPIEIGRLQRHAMDHFYESGAELPDRGGRSAAVARKSACSTQHIACIGGGPASMSCGAELHRLGYAVTIFEAKPQAGGLNTYGVADYKLRPPDSLREVALLQSLGVEFRTRVNIGEDVPLEDIEREFDATFIGVGLGPADRLGIPGEDLEGVIDALHFIAAYKHSWPVPLGNRAVVVGGGNTAIDAAVAARLLGAEDVAIVYRRGASDMPAFEFELEHASLAGVRLVWQALPVSIRGDGGRVEGIELRRTEPGPPDASGRPAAQPVAGSEFVIACDTVIVALGQAKLARLFDGRQIVFQNGRISADPRTGQTANPKYFAGGDCVNGGSEVVDAVAEGKRAARGIAAWIERRHG